MRLRIIVGITLVALLAGCAGGPTPNTVPESAKPAVDTAVAIGRGLARVGIAAALDRAGASDAVVTATLDSLHKAADELLAGKSIADVVTDPALWATFRDQGVARLAGVLTTAVPAIDQKTAELLIGQVLDAARDYVKQRLGRSAASAQAPPSRADIVKANVYIYRSMYAVGRGLGLNPLRAAWFGWQFTKFTVDQPAKEPPAVATQDWAWPSSAQMADYYRAEGRRQPDQAALAETLSTYEEGMAAMVQGDDHAAMAELRECQRLARELSSDDTRAMTDAADFWIAFIQANPRVN